MREAICAASLTCFAGHTLDTPSRCVSVISLRIGIKCRLHGLSRRHFCLVVLWKAFPDGRKRLGFADDFPWESFFTIVAFEFDLFFV